MYGMFGRLARRKPLLLKQQQQHGSTVWSKLLSPENSIFEDKLKPVSHGANVGMFLGYFMKHLSNCD